MTTLPTIADPVAVRRELHRFPETGFLEIRTANLIWESLSSLPWSLRAGQDLLPLSGYAGLPTPEELDAAAVNAHAQGVSETAISRFRDGATTIVADLEGNRPGPRVGFRFDMDALPILESERESHFPTQQGFASQNAGRMHACGHDGHVAIGLHLAALLATDPSFAGSVRLIFQPAEEGVRGAHPIVNGGLCDDLDVMIAVHLGFGAPRGSVCYATDLLGTSKFETVFEGHAVHASNQPEKGRNALLAAAHAIMGLHSLPRFSKDSTRVNVGHLICEGASNIVPGKALMRSEVRASSAETHRDLEARALNIIESAAALTNVSSSTRRTGYAVTAESSLEVYEALALRAIAHGFTAGGLQPMRASDDATLMMERVVSAGGDACYLVVGSGDYGPHHSSLFDFDEEVLPRVGGMLFDFIHSR